MGIRFAVIFPWPGIKNAETELISRFIKAADEEGMECVPVDNRGYVLDSHYELTDKKVANIDFAISLHYDTPKLIDTFYYHALWNPPEIPLRMDYYEHIIDNYLMNDDYLIYDKGSMYAHLQTMLMESPRDLKNASVLMGSFPKSAIMKPNLDDPKLFYCGMNWDVLLDKKGRNESVMKMLDDAEVIKIFGPNDKTNPAWGEIHPWGGYKCYQYPIPFDGFSLVNELNKCGICLVLSSDIHRRAGAVTNRAFEACAAGAVIIADDNPLMKEMFGDSILTVNYSKAKPKATYEQIIDKYNWILNHKDEALAMAKKSQQLFVEKYSMNDYLNSITENHCNRISAVKKMLFAKDETKTVAVLYICNTNDAQLVARQIDIVVGNVNKQIYRTVKLVVAVDESVEKIVHEVCKKNRISFELIPLSIYDDDNNRKMTNGQILKKIRSEIEYDYFTISTANEIWYSDHITTLVRALENEPLLNYAYAGQSFADNGDIVNTLYFDMVLPEFFCEPNHLLSGFRNRFPVSGAFLFRKACNEYLPDYVFDCLDGGEYIALVQVALLNHGDKGVFTKRMTISWERQGQDRGNQVIKSEQESRFIFGLSRYNQVRAEQSALDERSLADWFSNLPIKPFIRFRIARIAMRVSKEDSVLHRWGTKIYKKGFEEYLKLSHR